jgi:hypothetical protein
VNVGLAAKEFTSGWFLRNLSIGSYSARLPNNLPHHAVIGAPNGRARIET